MACENGHLEVAQWLWTICSDEEQSAMLHAKDNYAFCAACHNGHIEIAKWLFGLCQTVEEQKAMLHAQDRFCFLCGL